MDRCSVGVHVVKGWFRHDEVSNEASTIAARRVWGTWRKLDQRTLLGMAHGTRTARDNATYAVITRLHGENQTGRCRCRAAEAVAPHVPPGGGRAVRPPTQILEECAEVRKLLRPDPREEYMAPADFPRRCRLSPKLVLEPYFAVT